MIAETFSPLPRYPPLPAAHPSRRRPTFPARKPLPELAQVGYVFFRVGMSNLT